MNTVTRILCLLGIPLAVLVGVLAWQNRSLREALQANHRAAVEPSAGFIMPALRVGDLKGDSMMLGQSDGGRFQLLLVFNTTCEYCRESVSAWKRITQIAEADPRGRVEVIGVSLDSAEVTARYVSELALPYRVALLPGRWVRLFRFGRFPSIVMVDSSGTVVYSRVGSLTRPGSTDSVAAAVRGIPLRADSLSRHSLRVSQEAAARPQ